MYHMFTKTFAIPDSHIITAVIAAAVHAISVIAAMVAPAFAPSCLWWAAAAAQIAAITATAALARASGIGGGAGDDRRAEISGAFNAAGKNRPAAPAGIPATFSLIPAPRAAFFVTACLCR